VRGVAWAEGGDEFATISDPFMENDALISIYQVPEKSPVESYNLTPRLEIELPKENIIKATNVVFLGLNSSLFVTFDDGSIRLYDVKTGSVLNSIHPHQKKVREGKISRDRRDGVVVNIGRRLIGYFHYQTSSRLPRHDNSNPINATPSVTRFARRRSTGSASTRRKPSSSLARLTSPRSCLTQ
jgi:WD40 repeat protein